MKLKTLAVLSCMPLVGCLGEVEPELGVDEEAVVAPLVTSPAGGGRFLALRANYVDQRFYAGTDISGLMIGTPVAGGLASAPDTWNWENYAEPGAAAPAGPAPATYEGISTGEIHDIGFVAGTEMVFAATPDGLYRRATAASNWQLVFGNAPSIPLATLSALTGVAFTSGTSPCTTLPTLPWCDARADLGWRPASVQAVAVSRRTPAATSVVWFGMGERRSVNPGAHQNRQPYLVYRSLDSGTTWFPVFSIHLDPGPLSRVGPMINAIEADPLDPNVVYLATDMGLYRTTNGLAPAVDVEWTELGRPTLEGVRAGRYAPAFAKSWAFPERVASPLATSCLDHGLFESGICLPTYGRTEGEPVSGTYPLVPETHPNVRDVALGRDAAGTSYVHVVIDSNAVAEVCPPAALPLVAHRLASNAYTTTNGGLTWERRILAADSPPHEITCVPGNVNIQNTHYTSIQASGNDIAIARYQKDSNGGAFVHVGAGWDAVGGACPVAFESNAYTGLYDDGMSCGTITQRPMSWDLWVQNWGVPTPLMPALGPLAVITSTDRNLQRYRHPTISGVMEHILDQEDLALTTSAMGAPYTASTVAAEHFWRAQGPSNLLINTNLIRLGTRHYVGSEDAGLLVTPNNGASWGRVGRIHGAVTGVSFNGASLVLDPRVFPNRLFTITGSHLGWIDDNAAASPASYAWTTLAATAPGLSAIRQIALDPRGAGRVLLATNAGLFSVDTASGASAPLIQLTTDDTTKVVAVPYGPTYAAYVVTGAQIQHVNLTTRTSIPIATYTGTLNVMELGAVSTSARLYVGTSLIYGSTTLHAGYTLSYIDVDPGAPASAPMIAAASTPGAAGNPLPSPTGSRVIDGNYLDTRWLPSAMAVDPANPMHALVGFGSFHGMWPTAIFETTTAGVEWHVAQQYATLPQKNIHAITFLDGRVYFSTGNGIVGF